MDLKWRRSKKRTSLFKKNCIQSSPSFPVARAWPKKCAAATFTSVSLSLHKPAQLNSIRINRLRIYLQWRWWLIRAMVITGSLCYISDLASLPTISRSQAISSRQCPIHFGPLSVLALLWPWDFELTVFYMYSWPSSTSHTSKPSARVERISFCIPLALLLERSNLYRNRTNTQIVYIYEERYNAVDIYTYWIPNWSPGKESWSKALSGYLVGTVRHINRI